MILKMRLTRARGKSLRSNSIELT